MKLSSKTLLTAIVASFTGNAIAQQQQQGSLRGGVSAGAVPARIDGQFHLANNNNDDLTAVIHIGPMKTGSSAIQASLGIVVPEIERLDNYEDAGFAMDKGIEAYHMVGCFRPDAAPYTGGDYFEISCHPDALNQVAHVAERKHNLIITAEYLTDPKTDLVQFKEFLKPWKNHKIVAYYRRYYDWVLSFHNQIYKQQSPATRKKISDFVTHESKFNFLWETMYLVDAVERYSHHFDNIHVINMYDLPNQDARVAFYCDGLPNANASCEKFKKYIETEPKHVENPSIPLIYSDLTYFAQEMGLWSESISGLSSDAVAALAQKYQEETLHKKSHEFGEAVICPSEETLDKMLQKSLQVEQDLFPAYFEAKGRDEMIAHFNKIKHTKMCHVDAQIVLQTSNEWKDFFRGILYSSA